MNAAVTTPPAPVKYHLSLSIHGKVQGVNFRMAVQQWARDLDLTGFVSNSAIGTVDIEVQGDKAKLEEFTQLCQAGPPQAQVSTIDQRWGRATEDYFSFEIR